MSPAFENNLPALLQCETASGPSEPSTARSTRSLPPSRFVKAQSQKHVKPLIQGLSLPNAQNPYQDILRIAFFVVVDGFSLKLKK